MIRLRDEYGLTALGISLLAALACVVVVGLAVWVSWLAWPKDAGGNPLPCTHTHQETTFILVGKVLVPTTTDVCDAWATPTPGTPQ